LPKNSVIFNISTINWHHGNPETISVTTKRGTIFTAQAIAP
jgi:hypothetical protein